MNFSTTFENKTNAVLFDIPYHPNREQALMELENHLFNYGIITEKETVNFGDDTLGIETTSIIAGISALLSGGLLVKLGEAIVAWVQNYKTDLTVKNKEGEEITISSKLTKDEIYQILDKFLKRSQQAS